jgi:hypothetical protein
MLAAFRVGEAADDANAPAILAITLGPLLEALGLMLPAQVIPGGYQELLQPFKVPVRDGRAWNNLDHFFHGFQNIGVLETIEKEKTFPGGIVAIPRFGLGAVMALMK